MLEAEQRTEDGDRLRRKEEGKRQNKDKDDQLRRGKKVGFESTFEGWDTVRASG